MEIFAGFWGLLSLLAVRAGKRYGATGYDAAVHLPTVR